MLRVLRAAALLVKDAYLAWRNDRAAVLSAALAYYGLFSLAPLLVIALAMASAVYGPETARLELMQRLGSVLDADTALSIVRIIEHTEASRSGPLATALGVLLLLFGATRVFDRLQYSLNSIWGSEPTHARGVRDVLRHQLISFLMVLAIGVVLVTSIVAGTALSVVRQSLESALVDERAAPESSAPWLDMPSSPILPLLESIRSLQLTALLVSLIVTAFAFAALFKLVPNVRLEWRDVWIGAGVTAALFQAGRFGIGYYVTHASIASTYGAAGSLVVVLLWVNYSAQILYYGAEFTKLYAQRYGSLR